MENVHSQLETTKRKQVRPLPECGTWFLPPGWPRSFSFCKDGGDFSVQSHRLGCCALGGMRLEGEEGQGGPD